MRVIHMDVAGDTVRLDSSVAGVQGSGNVDTIVIHFDESWDGFAKTAAFWDAHGKEAGDPVTLTFDKLANYPADTRTYLLLIPAEALRFAGACSLVVDGWKEGRLARSMSQELQVAAAPKPQKQREIPANQDITLQAQIDGLLGAVAEKTTAAQAAQAAAEEAARGAELSAETALAADEEAALEAERAIDARRGAETAKELAEELCQESAEQFAADLDAAQEQADAAWASAMQAADMEAAARESMENAELAKDGAQAARQGAEAERLEAQKAAEAARKDREQVQTDREAVAEDKKTVQGVQAALQLRRRLILGTAEDAQMLQPGDVILFPVGEQLGHVTDYRDLLDEAWKAAKGEDNSLETLAVLSTVNATNWRRDAQGTLWDTESIGEFREKLTALAAAAAEARYVRDGKCVLTWAQGQAWLLDGVLLSPLVAEGREYPWRTLPPKSEVTALQERVTAMEEMLGQWAANLNTMVNGGNYR